MEKFKWDIPTKQNILDGCEGDQHANEDFPYYLSVYTWQSSLVTEYSHDWSEYTPGETLVCLTVAHGMKKKKSIEWVVDFGKHYSIKLTKAEVNRAFGIRQHASVEMKEYKEYVDNGGM